MSPWFFNYTSFETVIRVKSICFQVSSSWCIGLILGPALGGFLAQVILLLVISCEEMRLKIPLGMHVLMRVNAFKNTFCGGCHTPRTGYVYAYKCSTILGSTKTPHPMCLSRDTLKEEKNDEKPAV